MVQLAARQPQGDLGVTAPEVELEWDQGQSLLLHGADHAVDLPPVEQKLAGAYGIMVVPVALLVRCDGYTLEEDLAAAGTREPFFDGSLTGAERL